MTRSTKKPYFTDQHTDSKKVKRTATRKVRKAKEVADGSAYKKESNSYNICDYSFYSPKNKKATRK